VQTAAIIPPTAVVVNDVAYDNITGTSHYATSATPNPANYAWMYHFSTRLFDYLTVQSPASDYKPNIDTNLPAGSPNVAGISPVKNGTGNVANPYPNNPPSGITLAQTTNGEEVTTGIEGLVNINTAPWWVIASLPLLPNRLAGADLNNNGFPDNIENLAKQIVYYRDGDGTNPAPGKPGETHGPFRSIMDLNGVTDANGNLIFRNAIQYAQDPAYDFGSGHFPSNAALSTPHDSTAADGDVSPAPSGADGVTNDFEEQTLMISRISNLITTRSDSFTVYIVVQGWRNAGTTNPQLVVQRRAAFIIDRSNVTGVSGAANPKITTVPTD
jgi:hypothetical protein